MDHAAATKPPLYKSLYFQVICAIIIGVLLGYFYPSTGEAMKPLGDGFIKLIKMMIAPIIFCTVVVGIAGMEDMKKVGKTGGLALLYFEVVSTVSLVIGLVLINLLQPGAGMNIDPAQLDTKAIAAYTKPGALTSPTDFILHIIPDTIVGAFATGEILQVLLFAILFGFALHKFGGRGTLVFDWIERTSHVLFAIVGYIMRVAPIGAFGAMAFTIGKFGVASLLSLGKLMGTFYLTCLLFVFVVLGLIAWYHGFSIFKFVRYIKEELLIVLGTSSSESVLPRMMVKMENLGVNKSTVGLVIPAGYSFNLDGTSIYLTMAAVFIAQATNTHLTLMHELTLLGVLILTSKGASGVTGSGFIVLAATLGSVENVPVAGLALILGIDRFMSEARSLTNLVGNGVATVVVGKWCGELDVDRMNRVLNRETGTEADAPERVLDRTTTHENAHA
jgi:aerobic C4-dicarboxylate transport protein